LPAFSSNLDVTPPLVTIPFDGATNSSWMLQGSIPRFPVIAANPIKITADKNITYPDGGALASLRHRWVANADNTLVLIQRSRVSAGGSKEPCAMQMPLGLAVSPSLRPEDKICWSFVVAANGKGACVGSSSTPMITHFSDFAWMKLIRTRSGGEFGSKCFTPGCARPASHVVYLPD
jgi:hypothetical protein